MYWAYIASDTQTITLYGWTCAMYYGLAVTAIIFKSKYRSPCSLLLNCKINPLSKLSPHHMPVLHTIQTYSLSQADASFSLTLTDCNDNPPVFGSSGEYHISIMEGSTSANNPLLTVTTSDLDSSAEFRAVTYEIVGGTPETNGWIDIDSNVSYVSIL